MATRKLVDAGAAAVFVSHRLDEVLSFADIMSVIREGRMVATLSRAEADEEELIRLILGRELGSLYPRRTRPLGEEVMVVERLGGKIARMCRSVSTAGRLSASLDSWAWGTTGALSSSRRSQGFQRPDHHRREAPARCGDDAEPRPLTACRTSSR